MKKSIGKSAFWALIVAICYMGCLLLVSSSPYFSTPAIAENVAETTNGILNYSDGAVYEGDFLTGNIREGTGTYTWSTGETYSGSWSNDKFSGEGKLTWPNLGTYEGFFENGKRQGEGTFTWMYDGEPEIGQPISFRGQWDNDKIGETGTLILAGIGTYEGEFARQTRNGQGTFTWENGDVYSGKWMNDAISGVGTLTLADGAVLNGQFSNGSLSKGTVTYSVNGGTAVRDVAEGRVQAKVTITYTDGTVVSGKLTKNEFTGNITVNYPSGDTYVGTLLYGEKDGKGTYTWKSGAHYIGEWSNDKMSGTGKYYYTKNENHTYLSGTFVDGIPSGKLTYVSEKKLKYETTWTNGTCTSIKYKK